MSVFFFFTLGKSDRKQRNFHYHSLTSVLVHCQAHHLRCLNDFVEAQSTYYAQCYQYMVDLQKQLGR